MRIFAAILAFVIALPAVAVTSSGFRVRAGSFNIRCETTNDTGDKSWGNRKADLAKFVRDSGLDVVGFQEVKSSQKTYLNDNLSGYTFFAGTVSGSSEYVSVAYKTARFNRLDGGTFWLSATPEKQSKFSDSQYYRICTWTLLQDKETSGKVLFASTHLDLVAKVRLMQMQVIMKFTETYRADGVNVIVVGDMNEYESDSAMVAAAGVFLDAACEAQSVSGPWRTYNAWTYVDSAAEPKAAEILKTSIASRNPLVSGNRDHKRIDFIFVSKPAVVETYVVRNDVQTGKSIYHSDHYMIYSDLVLPVRKLVTKGRIKVEISAECPSVASGRRFQLTSGAMIEDARKIDFVLPDWVERACVEDGEIVVYTKAQPLIIYVR